MKSPAEIFKEAKQAGDAAVFGAVDRYPCGFAWVTIKPARGEFVKYLKDNNIGRKDDYYGGYTISSYECCEFSGQCMDVKEDGVRAFTDVLKSYGILATVRTRID